MLRNVLEDYLNKLKDERSFDAPFAALLSAMGFYDIHFTHGQVEFGKDFVAKNVEKGRIIQYSFQSKCGDINQAEWRNNIQGQMLEAVTSKLSHPNFDTSLPHQSMLVTTGRLIGNAALGMQNLNKLITNKPLKMLPVKLWDRIELIDLFYRHGAEGVHQHTAAGFISYGRFYIEYGKACSGIISTDEIERYSREWTKLEASSPSQPLMAILEAEVLAAKCSENGKTYEAMQCILGASRAVMYSIHKEPNQERKQWLIETHQQIIVSLRSACDEFITACRDGLASSDEGLLGLVADATSITTYPIHSSRLMEATGLLYF